MFGNKELKKEIQTLKDRIWELEYKGKPTIDEFMRMKSILLFDSDVKDAISLQSYSIEVRSLECKIFDGSKYWHQIINIELDIDIFNYFRSKLVKNKFICIATDTNDNKYLFGKTNYLELIDIVPSNDKVLITFKGEELEEYLEIDGFYIDVKAKNKE